MESETEDLRERFHEQFEMPKNSNYKSDIRYNLRICQFILALIGVWPSFNDTTSYRKVINWILQILCQLLTYFTLVPLLLFIYFKANSPRQIVKLAATVINCSTVILKHTALFYQRAQIRECIKHLEEDWRSVATVTDRKVMLKNAKVGRNLAIVCACFVYISGYSFRLIIPLLKSAVVNEKNITIKPLPIPGHYVFFNPQTDVIYETVFCLQLLSGFAVYASTSAVCSVAALFVMHACGQLDILIDKMINLVETNTSANIDTNEKLALVVEHHVRIKSFIQRMEDIVQQVCLIEVFGSTLLFCLLGYYVIIDWGNTVAVTSYFLILTSYVFNLFMYCFIGELLTEQGFKVESTLRSLPWYHLPTETARCLVPVIIMSSFPTKITAGRIMDLSFRTFSAIIRTSVSYLNILRATSI